ncbi:MAG: hypothetical protein R6U96_06695 [Promethearchaeia archaeon]
MRIRTREKLAKKNAVIVFLCLLPLLGVSTYGTSILYILYDINSFTFEPNKPNTDYFESSEGIDMTRLEEMAETFDYRTRKFNAPIGYPVDVVFKNRSYTYDAIDHWEHTDNGALHNAYALAAACLKYKVALEAGDHERINNITENVRFYVQALENLIAAPNGGIGKKPGTDEWYPGILSRFACSYQDAKKYHPFMLEPHVRHHNGTGEYKNWRIRLKTSRDEVSGFYLGWACVLKFIDPNENEDSKWCVDHVKTMVEQVIRHWKKESNWLVLDHNGAPTGSDINSPDWQLVGLRIAATACPEKYEALYHYVASKKLQFLQASMGDWPNAGFEYFAWMLAGNSMFTLILLEDDPNLQYHYIKLYESGMYNALRYHRNAYANILHLVFMSMLEPEQVTQIERPISNDFVRWDVLDQLWRFHTSNWCPIRNYNLTERPHSTRSTSKNPEIRAKKLDPSRKRWREFINSHPVGGMYEWLIDLFDMEDKLYEEPRTISEHWAQHMIWQSNPFKKEGGDPHGGGLEEAPGTSYTLVYWLGRAFEIF